MELLEAFGILAAIIVGAILRQWAYSYRSPLDFFKDFFKGEGGELTKEQRANREAAAKWAKESRKKKPRH